jgi:hypothetical protein
MKAAYHRKVFQRGQHRVQTTRLYIERDLKRASISQAVAMSIIFKRAINSWMRRCRQILNLRLDLRRNIPELLQEFSRVLAAHIHEEHRLPT